jgi:hypothetical protein
MGFRGVSEVVVAFVGVFCVFTLGFPLRCVARRILAAAAAAKKK